MRLDLLLLTGDFAERHIRRVFFELREVIKNEKAHQCSRIILERVVHAAAVGVFEKLVPRGFAFFAHGGHPAFRLVILHEFGVAALIPVGDQFGCVFDNDDTGGVLRHEIEPLLQPVGGGGGKDAGKQQGEHEGGAFHGIVRLECDLY